MSKNVWIGGATTTAQVVRYTPGTVEVNDVFTLTATGENGATAAVNFTATAATVANVTAGLTAAWNASTNALHTGITAADLTTSMTLTADVAGTPFVVTPSTTDGGGANTQTLTQSILTNNVGPNDFNTTLNWSLGSVPVNGDDVQFDGRAVNDLLYGLDQSTKTFATLYVKQSFGYDIGAVGGHRLKCGATVCTIGEPSLDGNDAGGSDCINIDLHTVATTVRIVNGQNAGTDGQPPIQLKINNNTATVLVENGTVGIGTDVYGEACSLKQLTVKGGRVTVGEGVSVEGTDERLFVHGGEVEYRAGIAGADSIVTVSGGTLRTVGSGAYDEVRVTGDGTFVSNATGTIGLLEVSSNGFADFGQNTAARTVSVAVVKGENARLNSDNGVPLTITWTAGVEFIDDATPEQHRTTSEVKVTYAAATL